MAKTSKIDFNPDNYNTIINFRVCHKEDEDLLTVIIENEKATEEFGKEPNKPTVAFGLTLGFLSGTLLPSMDYYFNTEEGMELLNKGYKKSLAKINGGKPKLEIVK